MKKKANILVLLFLVISSIFLFLHYAGGESNQEELSPKTNLPEDYLENIRKYRERFELNSYHLDKALASINELKEILDTLKEPLTGEATSELKILHERSLVHLEEIRKSLSAFDEYPNLSEQEHLSEAVRKLNKLDEEIKGDSLQYLDIYNAFDYTLNALAKAEVNLSKAAIRTDQRELAEITLRQAKIHVKNALLLDYFSADPNHKLLESEVYEELDSLLSSNQLTRKELMQEQTRISQALDALIQQKSTRE